MTDPLQTLQRYWGYDSFRPAQENIINHLLEKKDTLAILPTGGGKSICFQIPALMTEGCALVISPLIALMNDQVSELKKRNIPCEGLHSGKSNKDIISILESAQAGHLKFLYCSPERLQNETFTDFIDTIPWNYLIVDEAHCIAEWGHDFRPQYLNIAKIKNRLTSITVAAFTASATPETQKEIITNLRMSNPGLFINSIYRNNLSYRVMNVEQKEIALSETIRPASNIVYCNTRKSTQQTAEYLKAKGIDATYFHAGLSYKERNWIQQNWLGSPSQTICATNAFGMGINKADVRQVVHLNAPSSIEAYYQEAGRAGRDGKYAEAVLLAIPYDRQSLERSIDDKFPSPQTVKKVYDYICQQLGVGYHEGYEEKFFIDIPYVYKRSGVPALPFMSAIKILEYENYWVFNQDDITPNHVQILCSRAEMNFLEAQYPQLYTLLIQMLRIYGDIMHTVTPVSIELIAGHLEDSYTNIIRNLEKLSLMKLIHFKKNRVGSSLFLTQARMPSEFLNLDAARIRRRRKMFENKIFKMIEYIYEHQGCRQQFLASYFGEKSNTDCTICDNCLESSFRSNYKIIKKEVINFLQQNPSTTLNDLLLLFNTKVKEKNLLALINDLVNDEILYIKNNIIYLT